MAENSGDLLQILSNGHEKLINTLVGKLAFDESIYELACEVAGKLDAIAVEIEFGKPPFTDEIRPPLDLDTEKYLERLQLFSREENVCVTLLVMRELGMLEAPDIHINDLCGGVGLFSSVAILARRGLGKKTSSSCLDVDSGLRSKFEDLNGRLQLGGEFLRRDITKDEIPRREGVPNYWIVGFPENAIQGIFERIANSRLEDLPDGIVILPCSCHNYEDNDHAGVEEVSLEIWRNLCKAMKGTCLNDLGILERVAEMKKRDSARNLIDAFRVLSLMRRNSGLDCKIFPLIYNCNAILIKRAKAA